MLRVASLILAAGLLVAAEEKKDNATKDDVKKFQGNWTLVSGEHDGKKISDDVVKNSLLTVEGNKHIVKEGDKIYKGTHKLDATKKPKTIDIMDTEGPFKDKTVFGIYELNDDDFKICIAPPGKDRPSDFSAKAGSGLTFHVWKRKK